MDQIRDLFKKPLVLPAVCFVVGLLLGWIVLGWGLFPVEWTDATPEYLRKDLKLDYLRMAVDSFGSNGDAVLAQTRWKSLGPDAAKLLESVQINPQSNKIEAITGFTSAVNAAIMSQPESAQPAADAAPAEVGGETKAAEEPAVVLPAAGGETTTTLPATAPAKKGGFLSIALAVFLILTVVLVFAVLYIFIKKGGKLPGFLNRNKVDATPFEPPVAEVASDKGPEYFRPANEAPVSQFMTTYMHGEDQYDDSFSIDNPVGEFLGECGVGITESIGVGDPKKAAAFEVWLFDKNDIQTVTKVLMSEHVFKDPSMHQKLLSKGEPILAEPGKRILLETATLQLEARIVDMNYGQGPLPPNSYFDRLTLELAVWPKNK
jgi:hypothetical protein